MLTWLRMQPQAYTTWKWKVPVHILTGYLSSRKFFLSRCDPDLGCLGRGSADSGHVAMPIMLLDRDGCTEYPAKMTCACATILGCELRCLLSEDTPALIPSSVFCLCFCGLWRSG